MNDTSRRNFLKKTAAVSAAGMVGTLPVSGKNHCKSKRKKKPNLVYVFPDQMRRHAMGFMKQDPVITPNLDAFAKKSVVLDNVCST